MLKNELYFSDMSEIFEHTLQYFYYDVPIICSQSMVIGSNNVDFLRQNLSDHNVGNVLIGPLDYDKHFDLFHDYGWNPDNVQKHCTNDEDDLGKIPLRQTSSPGIIMIIEAENASLIHESSEKSTELIASAVENEGFEITSKIIPDNKESHLAVIVMKEGYIVIRAWPENHYCGFDIHLWSSFAKQESLKKRLISVVGSTTKSSSSYRVVAGGMFGVSTWKTDERKRGPRHTLSCDRPERESETVIDDDVMGIITEEYMTFLPKDATVLVVCGEKNSQPCRTLETLKKDKNLGQIVDVWSCTDLNGFASLIYGCERELLASLNNLRDTNKKIDALILDPSMNYSMGQILVRIFKNLKSKVELLSMNPTVMAISADEEGDWRSNLVNRFRTDVIIYDPLFKVDTTFEGADEDSFDVTIVATHEKSKSVSTLRSVLTSIEERAGVTAYVTEFLGGSVSLDFPFNPKDFFPTDYDQNSASEQWSSQQPLEFQTIFQLELQREKSKLSKGKLEAALMETISMMESSSAVEVESFSNAGEGCLFIALWSANCAILVWDGRKHVDINLSTDEEDDEFFEFFESKFIKKLPSLKTTLRDEQPRGYGKVINFLEDINSDSDPIWAK